MKTLRNHRTLVGIINLVAILSYSTLGYADTLYKANTGTNTTLDTATFTPAAPAAIIQNYSEGTAFTATDSIVFNNAITAASTFRVSNTTGTNLQVGGLTVGSLFNGTILNPAAAITIQNASNAAGGALIANTITLGAGGIDMSMASQNLTLSRDATVATNTMTLALSAPQTWKVNTGRTLTVSNDITTGGNALTIQGGIAGAGTVVLGSTTGAVTGGGALIINGPLTGAATIVTLSGNNGAAGLGATTVNGGTLNIDQSAASQNKLNDTAALTLNRATLNLQGTGAGTETVGNLVLGGSLNQITRSAGTGVLGAGAITRSAGAVLNVGAAGIATTTNANVNGILGGWAVINQTDFATNAFAAVTATTTAETGWTSALNEVQTANVTLTAGRAVNSLKFNGAGAQTFGLGAATLNVTSGGLLRNQNFTTVISNGTLTAGGAADTVADELFVWNNQNTMTISAVIANNGTDVVNLVKAGAGSLNLTGINTYTGTTTIAQGTLNFGDNAAGGNVGAFGAGNIINDGLIQINKTTAASLAQRTISNNISGVGAFTNLRGITTVLSGTNTYSGDTTVTLGTLQADSVGGFSPNSRMILNAAGVGAINNSVGGVSVSALRGDQSTAFFTLGAFDLTLSGVDPTSNGAVQNYQGIISGAGGLVKNGIYTQVFTAGGALSYTGTTTVNAGTLQFNKASTTTGLTVNGTGLVIANAANITGATAAVNLAGATSTWQINNGFNQSISSLTGVANSRLAISRGATATNLTVTDNGGAPATFAGVVQEFGSGVNGASFTKAGTNTLILTGGNNYSGATTINDGTLQVGLANAVQVIPDRSSVVLADVATAILDLNGNNETIGSLSGGGAVGGNILLGAGTLTVGLDNTSPTAYAGIISGAGGLNKVGNGTLSLTGANTFTGPVTLSNLGGQSGGGLTLGGTLADTVSIRNSGWNTTLTINNTDTVGTVTGTRNTTIALGTGATLTTSYTNGTPTALAATADSASANGRIVRNINTTGLKPGDLISGTGVSAPGYIVQIISDDMVLVNRTPPTGPTNDFAPTVTSTSVLNSALTGLGGFTKNGTGLLVLTGNSNHSGATTINEGTVQVGGTWTGQKFSIHDTLSDNSSLVFASTGSQILNFADSSTNLQPFERIGSLAGGNPTGTNTTINLTNGSTVAVLAFGGDNTSTTYSGNFLPGNSAGVLIKEGTGTFTWANPTNDTFDGVFEIRAGGLTSANQGLDGAQVVRMANNATTFTSGVTDTLAIIEGGAGMTRTQPNTGFVGALYGNHLTGTAPSVVLSTGTITTLSSGTSSGFNGVISGAGALTKAGTGTWQTYGANTYTGETRVDAGTLTLGVLSRSAGVGAVSGSDVRGSLADTTSLRLTGGTLSLNNLTETVAGIGASSSAGTIAIGNGTLNFAAQTTQTTGTAFSSNLNGILNLTGSAANQTLSLTGNSAAFLGTINVGTNAALILNRATTALGDTAQVNLNGTGTQLTVTLADTIGSLSGTGNAVLTQGLTLQEARSGTVSATGYSGTTSGGGVLALSNYGGLTLSGNNASTGGTTLSNGSRLVLNYGAGNNVLPTGILTLNGANITLASSAATASILESAASTTLGAGSSSIDTVGTFAASTAISQSRGASGLGLGAITRNAGATLNVGTNAASTSTANVNGILGGYAVFENSTWAVANGAGTAISGLATGSYVNTFGTATANTDVIATGVGGNTNSIRFNTAGAFDVQTTATVLSSGGVLVTRGVGANTSTISAALSATGNELIIHQNNPLGDLVLSNVAGTNTIITTAGAGKTLITNNIAGTGANNIGGGYLQLGDTTAGGSATGMVGSGNVLNNGTLGINRNNPVAFGTAVISGIGNLEQLGSGTTTLGATNTFQGRVTVRNGTLEVTNNAGLGAAATAATNRWANLTSVNTGGTLLLNVAAGGAITETLNLDGGTLDLRSTVATTLGAPIILTSDSTIHVSNPGAAVSHIINGEIYALPGSDLSFTGVGGATPSTLILNPTATSGSRWENTNVGTGAIVQVGTLAGSRGYVGTGNISIATGGTLAFSTNDNYVISNNVTGSGTLALNRNSNYLTGDLSGFSGTLLVTPSAGQNINVAAELGNDTYGSSFGTGPITVTASAFAGNQGIASVRTHFNQDVTMSNTITLNPAHDGPTNAKNAQFIRAGLGNVTLDGTINLGLTTAGLATQRNLIQSEAGGKLLLNATLAGGGASNILNIVNNNIIVLGGSASQTYNGVLSGNNVWVFNNAGTTTLTGVNTFNTGSTYLRNGTVAIGTGGVDTWHNDNDTHVLSGATLSVLGNETIGLLHMQRGATTNIATGATLTVDDNVPQLVAGAFTGAGNLTLAAGNFMAMYGTNTASGNLAINQGAIVSPNLTNAIGSFATVTLGSAAVNGGLEYVGAGETLAKNLTLAGTGSNYIAANGTGALVIGGNITATGATSTLRLIGQTGGYFNSIRNQVTGAITEGANVLSIAMPSSGDDDRFGITSRWALTNASNDFSGAVTVNVGMLEFAGDLKTGVDTTSVAGDLSVARTFTLGSNNFNGRRYDMFGNGDQLADAGFSQGTNTLIPAGDVGTIIFNDPNVGTANLTNITWANPNTTTTNTSGMQFINNGVKQVNLFNAFSFGTTGNRVVVLDGSNTLSNTINGAIGNPTTTQATRIDKEGAGTWRLAGTNTYTGATTIHNGILEIAGGAAINDANTVAISADGGDGLYSGTAMLRILGSETFANLTGDIGTEVQILSGQTLTLRNGGNNTYNGIISNSGRLTTETTGATGFTVTLPNKNTYSGITTLGSSGAATGNNGLSIYHIANGGVASGIGAGTSAATDLVFTTTTAGTNGGILSWLGFNNQSTDRLFTMGLGTAGARINAAGTVVGTTAPTLTFSNTGAIAFTGSGARTLILGGATISDNTFRPQLTDGGGATTLSKVDAGLWLINPDAAGNTYTGGTTITGGTLAIQAANALGTGTITINGAAGIGLEIRGGAGITLTNAITNSTGDGGIGVRSGTNVISNTLTTAVNVRLDVDSGASLEFNNATTMFSGAGQPLKLGNGTLVLSGNNTGTGAFFARDGVLELNYTTNDTSKLADGAALTLGGITIHTAPGIDANVAGQVKQSGQGGGTLHLNGGTHVEHVSGLTLEPGSNKITRAGGSTATINIGAITRAVNQGTIDFGAGSIASTLSTNTNNIIGGYATVGQNSWATSAATQNATVPWVDAGDTITLAGYTNGQTVSFSGTAPAGLTAGTKYYVVNATAGNFQVSTTLGGAAVPLTNSGAAATMNTSGAITALGTYAADAYATGNNTDVTVAAANTGAATLTNTIRFNTNQATTLTIGAAFGVQGTAVGLQSGGILVTPAVGAFDTVITGGPLQNATSTVNLDTIVHQHNTNGVLEINSVIQNNTLATAQGLTKTGAGKLILSGLNTYSGFVNLYEGEIQVGGTSAAPTTATNAYLSGSGLASGNNATGWQLAEGTTLRFLTTNTAIYNTPAFNGEGKIIMDVGNQGVLLFDDDNGNYGGDIDFLGGTIRGGANNNALGNVRGLLNVDNSVNFMFTGGQTFNKVTNYAEGTVFNIQNFTTTQTGAFSGKQNFNNTTVGGLDFNLAAPTTAGVVGLNLSGIIYGTSGFTKSGNGILQVSATNFTDVYDGYTGLNDTPSLTGQIAVNAGILYIGGARALGAHGVGNEVIVASGASVDFRGAALNYGDDSDLTRKIFKVQGAGFVNAQGNATGALRNSLTNTTGVLSFLTLDGDAMISSGGTSQNSPITIGTFDTNLSNANGLTGAFTRNSPVIDGGGFDLTIQGGRIATDNFVISDPSFSTALGSLIIREGGTRFRHEIAANIAGAAGNAITGANITNGIEIGYGGTTAADLTGATASYASSFLGANVGSRLLFENYFGTHHTVDITMNGVIAATAPGTPGGARSLAGGYNYLQVDFGTIPDGTTYLDGTLSLTGTANRNLIINDSVGNYTVQEQGNLVVAPAAKLVFGGVVQGTGGFTKQGQADVRFTAANTFSGDVNVLRLGVSASPWESHTYKINGVDYATNGLGEGWAEWSLTLNGANGAFTDVGNINLQRRGMITLDNTTRLAATSGVAGGNNNNRIADDAVINLEHGWFRINTGAVTNTEVLGTLNNNAGSNIIDLYGTDGAGVATDLTITTLNRTAGSTLRITNLDATSTFSTANSGDSARVAVGTLGAGAALFGGGGAANSSTMSIATGVFGGNAPIDLTTDLRILGFNNGNISDLWNQQRNLQFAAGSHFMTMEGGFLRPLDNDEYFTASTGVINPTTLGGTTQNVNLSDANTVVSVNSTINALRMGALTDHDGTGATSLIDHHAINLWVDGTLTISSGMISSAYWTVGNTSSASTVIAGGALDFNGKEAILNNQSALFRLTDGIITGGTMELRSAITNAVGLTKTGFQRINLAGANTYTGLTTIHEGILDLQHGRTAAGVGGTGNGIVVIGSGELRSNNGIQVGTAAAREDIYVGILAGDQQIMRVETDLTNWFSNITIDNVDAAGQALFTPRIRTDNSATSILNGDLAGGDTLISNDVLANDSRLVQFDAAGNNVFILRGVVGDRYVGGAAVPIADVISTLPTLNGTRTNENEVLRVNLAGGSLESNFILDRQYNAAGRLALSQGNMFVNYNPAGGGLDGTGFWTDAAISKIPNADSTTTTYTVNGGTTHQGFTMTGGGVYLTTPGQIFNMASFLTSGATAKYLGGINESGTVTFGNGTGSLSVTAVNNASALTNLHATDGGTVVFDMRLTGNSGTAPSSFGFLKQGRGNVVLQNTALAAAADSNFVHAGGTLTLNHTGATVQALVGNQNARFDGGTLISVASTGANTTASLATNDAADRVLNFSVGGTEIVARGNTGGRTMTVNMGNANANGPGSNFTRGLGATANLVEDSTSISGAGAAQVTLQFNASSTAAVKNQVIPWATYGTLSRTATDFAMSDAGNANDVRAYGRALDEFKNSVSTWAANEDVSENGGAGFSGSLGGALTLSTLRFDANADSTINLGTNVLTVSGNGLATSGGGILVSSNVGSANKTITGGVGSALTTSGGRVELILHHYGTGNLNVNVPITGAGVDLTIAGPSTTNAATIGTTGAVVLGAANTYDGITQINGAVLSFNNANQLGTNATASAITMNGGTLRYTGTGLTSLGTKGIEFQGNGGTLDITDGAGELYLDTAIISSAQYRGDLIKVGAGTLTLNGASAAFATAGNPGFLGLIDVRQGTLRVAVDHGNNTAGNGSSEFTGALGSSTSYMDGTILRTGTNLAIQFGNANDGGTFTIPEWFTFEGNNYVSVGTVNTQSAGANNAALNTNDTATSGVLNPVAFNPNNDRPINLGGVNTIKGTTTFDVVQGQSLQLNGGNVGYTTGNGTIIKDGQGAMLFNTNNPDFTGAITILQGRLYAVGQADVLGTGYTVANGSKVITLGSDSRQGIAELSINSDSIHGNTMELNHDVNVVYNPAQAKRIYFETFVNGSQIEVNGAITLNDNLNIYLNDGAEVGGSQNYVNINSGFKDGATTSGNILFHSDDTGNANDNTNGRVYNYLVLKADNSLFTGDIRVNANTGYDQDQTAILRLEHNSALTAANDVDMGFNSILQAGGGSRTIGTLSTNGGVGPFLGGNAGGTMGSTNNGTSVIIENAASTAGTLTITQTTPSVVEAQWNAHFRDGTLNSEFFAPGAGPTASAALNIVKAGNGWATLTVDNAYTGSTTVTGGILQVGRNGVGDTGTKTTQPLGAAQFTSNTGTTVAGTGSIQGLTVINGNLRPGDEAGGSMGTLTINGNATLGSTANTFLQVQRSTYTAFNALGYGDANYASWIGGLTSDPTYSHMLNDPVTTSQHDRLTINGTLTAGGKITLLNNGYNPAHGDVFKLIDWTTLSGTFSVGGTLLNTGLFRTGAETGLDLDLFELGSGFRWDVSLFNTQGIVVVVVPEPGRALLMLLGLMALFFRRRRHTAL